jgi:hypothetical protein
VDTLFETSDDDLLKSVYARQGRTLDDLPYTPEFEAIAQAMGAVGSQAQRSDLFHRLHNLRKSAKLPRLGRAAEPPPRIAPEHEVLLSRLVERDIGKLSLRDRLPYTSEFDAIVTSFNSQAGLNLSPHDVWRIIAKLAK